MSNILFVLYHDFSANSAVHVHNFANGLADRGHNIAVAIPPEGKDIGSGFGVRRYTVTTFPQLDGEWSKVFGDSGGPDVVHAWTPRENVRLCCEKLRSFASFTLVIHLEDNEELILEVNLGRPFEELAASPSIKFPHNLSHPHHYRRFIASADGVTMIMDRLAEFVSGDRPTHILWPGADRELFNSKPQDRELLASLGIPADHFVLCYTGNVHSANAREVRSLYLAAAILTREGLPTTLIRTGRNFCDFLGPDEEWAKNISLDLGHLDYSDIARVVSLADVLIQPGTQNAFNEYRLPGKLPEFFAVGRPVIVPETNLGRFLRHGENAYVLPKVDALGIVDAVRAIKADPGLAARLARGASDFCAEHFDWKKNTEGLETFYDYISPKPAADRDVRDMPLSH